MTSWVTVRLVKKTSVSILLALLALPAFAAAPSITARSWVNIEEPPQLENKVVLVDFWATWCLPCVFKLSTMQAYADEFKSGPFALVGVHYESKSTQIPLYLRDQEISFPVAIDTGETFKRFSIAVIPTYVLFDKQGCVRFQGNEPPSTELIAQLIAE